MHGKLEPIDCPPLSEVTVSLPYTMDQVTGDGMAVLTVSFATTRALPGLAAGFTFAWDQFVLRPMPQPVAEKDGGDLHYDHRGNRVEVQGADFDLTIQNGRVVSWVIDGSQRLVAPLEPAYFRALTDNDIDFLNFVPPLIKFHPLYGWRRAQRRTHALRTVVQAGADNTVEVHIAMSTPRLREDLITYKIYPNGRLYVYHSAVPKQDMLRFGFQMTLPGSYEYVNWYGRGPHPSYRDRKTGAALGRYQSTVTALEHRYMRPQESSNRTDTYDLYLCDSHGEGFRVQAYYETPFAFSAYHYTTTGLDKAAHIHEIPYDPSLTTLNIDGAQCGVGGDLPGQGAVRAPYRVTAGEKCSYAFVLEPMHKKK